MTRKSVVITDCHCANAVLRQFMVWQNFAGTAPPAVISITGDIDGAGMLVDALVEARREPWVIFCQSSPRDTSSADSDNGSPFAYFWYENTLVIASVAGRMLSLAKELGFIDRGSSVQVMDVSEVVDHMVYELKMFDGVEGRQIKHSQFRSLKFAPQAVGWILGNIKFPTTELPLAKIPDFGKRIWWIDNFGNCKTSLRDNHVHWFEGRILRTSLGDFPCIKELRAVPEGESAAVMGSSGIEGQEFIELVVQGVRSGSAAKKYELRIGSEFEVLS